MEPSGPGSSRGKNSVIFLIESLRKRSCLGLGAPKINLMTLLKDSVKNDVVTLVMERSSEWKAPIVRNYGFSCGNAMIPIEMIFCRKRNDSIGNLIFSAGNALIPLEIVDFPYGMQ